MSKEWNALARELRELKRQHDAQGDKLQDFADRLDALKAPGPEPTPEPPVAKKSGGILDDL